LLLENPLIKLGQSQWRAFVLSLLLPPGAADAGPAADDKLITIGTVLRDRSARDRSAAGID